jgi:hypothetical protein
MPDPIDARAEVSRWRAGVNDADSRAGHATQMRAWRQEVSDGVVGPQVRVRILAGVRAGDSIDTAARAAGTTRQRAAAIAAREPEWADALDDAARDAAPADTPHGTPSGYRHWRCRCRECGAAHHRPTSG